MSSATSLGNRISRAAAPPAITQPTADATHSASSLARRTRATDRACSTAATTIRADPSTIAERSSPHAGVTIAAT